MPELTDISVIRTLCEKYDFALSKGFGQNFIINPGIPTKIVDASGVDKRYGVIEIGPGIGVLTRELAKRAAKVVSIEVDERLPPLLAETMADVDNFKLRFSARCCFCWAGACPGSARWSRGCSPPACRMWAITPRRCSRRLLPPR